MVQTYFWNAVVESRQTSQNETAMIRGTYPQWVADTCRSVGMAHAEGRNFWMNGSSVHLTAGSMEQAQFLQHAGIEVHTNAP